MPGQRAETSVEPAQCQLAIRTLRRGRGQLGAARWTSHGEDRQSPALALVLSATRIRTYIAGRVNLHLLMRHGPKIDITP
ncbi:MAG: hypothetical protein ABJB69_07925 [Spartobacteria bacterium]